MPVNTIRLFALNGYLLKNVNGQSVRIDVLIEELLAKALQTGEGVVGGQFSWTEVRVVVAVRENGELCLRSGACLGSGWMERERPVVSVGKAG